MRSPRSCSSRPRRLATALALLAGAGAAGTTATAGAQKVRPVVVVDVRITGDEYRSRLGGRDTMPRAALEGALRDSVRLAMEQSFGFLDWLAVPRGAPDTIVVEWVNPRVSNTGNLRFTLRGKHRREGQAPVELPFESLKDIMDRRDDQWRNVSAMRETWLRTFRARLQNPSNAQLLVHRVLAQLPLKPLVTMGSTPEADVLVRLTSRDIRADPDRFPVFLVGLDMLDPATGPAEMQRRESSIISLAHCSRSNVKPPNYLCQVEYLVYPAAARPDTITDRGRLLEIARRTKRTPVTLHLWDYFPARTDDQPARLP